jgi:cytochrome b6-f complex iron-sulfur subunit
MAALKKQSGDHQNAEGSSRRSFLNTIWAALGIAAVAELVVVVTGFLRPHGKNMQPDNTQTVIDAGPVDSFQPESVTAFVRGKFYLCRLADGGFLAVSRSCTHLGCTVPWDDTTRRFACPCHASAYNIRGEVISPPAPRPLDLYPIAIANKTVKVNISKAIRRSTFELEQVVYPENR